MPQEKEYLTQEKYDELTKELEDLKSNKRKEIADQLEYSKSLGDLSENAEYHEARDAQANLEDRISHLEGILKTAVIISYGAKGVVSVGSEITVKKGSQTLKFTIVGSEEADAMQGKISIRSPFGEAVIGKKKGDSFSITTPTGDVEYEVTEVK